MEQLNEGSRRQLLRAWLRSKNIAPQDIAGALTWLDTEMAGGKTPTAKDVLTYADQSHATSVEQHRTDIPSPQIVAHYALTGKWSMFIAGALGAMMGAQCSELMPLLWLLVDYGIQLVPGLNG